MRDYRVLKKLLGVMDRFNILTLVNFLVNVYIHKYLLNCLLNCVQPSVCQLCFKILFKNNVFIMALKDA